MVLSVFESVNDGLANFDKVTSACKMPHAPVLFDNDALKAATDQKSFATVEKSAEVNSSSSTVHCHLQELGLVSKLGKWIPQTCRTLGECH